MTAPASSTFSAISELFITAGVFYVVFNNFRGRSFNAKVATAVIVFAFMVNMLSMSARMRQHTETNTDSTFVAFAAGHGFLSLLVFILFAVLAFMAYSVDKKEIIFSGKAVA